MAGGIAAFAGAEEEEPAATLVLLGATEAPAGGATPKVMSFVEEASLSELVRDWFELRLRSTVLVAGKEEVARGALRAFCVVLRGRFNFCSRSRCASAGWEFWSPVAVGRAFFKFAALVLCDGESASRLPMPSVPSEDLKSEWASWVDGGTMAFAREVVTERANECSIAPDLKMNAPTTQSATKNMIHLVIGVMADGDCPRIPEGEGSVDGEGATAELLRGNFGVDGDSALVFPLVFGKGSTMRC
jgi:hypothetical protein